MKYLPVHVFKHSHFGDCTNNGVSETHSKKLVIESENGFITQEQVQLSGYIIMELVEKHIGQNVHYSFKQKGDDRWLMFGGNFAYTSDSRFPSGQPIAIHDRYEG